MQKKIIAGILILLLAIAAALFYLTQVQSTISLSIFADLGNVVQQIVRVPAQVAENAAEFLGDFNDDYSRLTELEAQAQQYEVAFNRIAELEKENADLKAQIGLTNTLNDYEYVNAAIIARDVNGWNDYLTIDLGNSDGIETNMAIMAKQGLIGRVVETTATTATVQLVTSKQTNSQVSVSMKSTDGRTVYGIVEGYDETRKQLVIRPTETVNLVTDSIVLTSGLGGVFPAGITVGKVVEATTERVGGIQKVYVSSTVDFNDLQIVSVLRRLAE
ncbi:MAG: rod shape-determining protein MreC [Culicoidibacterales bacterium]